MAKKENPDWILDLYADQRAGLYRLATLLRARGEAGRIVRSAAFSLYRRGNRVIDPAERIEFLQEQVIHLTRPVATFGPGPVPDDGRHIALLASLYSVPSHLCEIIVVSHYLNVFGPELSTVMRMTLRGANQRLEVALKTLKNKAGAEQDIEALSQELTVALARLGKQIKVPPDEPLEEELLRQPAGFLKGRVRGQLVLVSCVVAVAIGAIGAAATRDVGEVATTADPTTTRPTVSTTAQSAVRAVVRGVPIYYLGRTNGLLYREYRDLPSTTNLARAAVDALFTLVPNDPDYTSPWDGAVNDVRVSGRLVTVDLDSRTYSNMNQQQVSMAINQLVDTLSEVLGERNITVRFLADGKPPPGLFAAVDGFSPSGMITRPGIWITAPRNLDQLNTGVLRVTGTSKPAYGAPVVTIINTDTKEQLANIVAQTTLTANQQGWLEWSVAVELAEPGNYEITAVGTPEDDQGNSLTAVSENKVIQVNE